MADHAVRGIDRLVNCRTRKTRDDHEDRRRHHAVREILGQALDRRARDASLVEFGRIAPDDLRHRHAARVDATLLQRIGHAGDMQQEASLCEQRAGEESDKDQAERQEQQGLLDDEGDDADNAEQRQHRHGPCPAARFRFGALTV